MALWMAPALQMLYEIGIHQCLHIPDLAIAMQYRAMTANPDIQDRALRLNVLCTKIS